MFKKSTVVMLPTNEKTKIQLTKNYLNITIDEFIADSKFTIGQHLYILSDEEIKEGDWCIMLDSFGNVFSNPQQYNNPETQHLNKRLRKIIATTDKSLSLIKDELSNEIGTNGEVTFDLGYNKTSLLPQPSHSFLEKYVEEYNKGNVIKEVMVEYEYNGYSTKQDGELTGDYRLKINPKDNTITIRKCKDSWSREEVVHLLECAWNGGAFYGTSKPNSYYFDKWIEENL